MRRALIDTNIYSLAMRGEPDVVDRLQQLDEMGFSVVSLGELLAGFRAGSQEAKNRQQLGLFLDSPRVRLLTIDEETADFYAVIVLALKRAGTPIPTNDIWIAAHAPEAGA